MRKQTCQNNSNYQCFPMVSPSWTASGQPITSDIKQDASINIYLHPPNKFTKGKRSDIILTFMNKYSFHGHIEGLGTFFCSDMRLESSYTSAAARPNFGCLFHFWRQKYPLFPIFCQRQKNPQKLCGIIPLLHAGGSERLEFNYCENWYKIRERIAREEGQRYSKLNTDGKLRLGRVLASALSALPCEKGRRQYEKKRMGEEGCRRIWPRYFKRESEIRSEEGTHEGRTGYAN